MGKAKFEIYLDSQGEYRFRLKATNGEIIASGEGYTTMQSCRDGIEAVKNCAANSDIVEVEK